MIARTVIVAVAAITIPGTFIITLVRETGWALGSAWLRAAEEADYARRAWRAGSINEKDWS